MALSNTNHLYWTTAQMVAHQTSAGCNLNAGDIFGTGTISAPKREGYGSMGEITETRRPAHYPGLGGEAWLPGGWR